MKAHLAKVSLALLSAAFLLGCQEQGSEPVGPEGPGPEFVKKGIDCGIPNPHPSCKDGGGEPTEADATVELSEGLKTFVAQDVQIKKDNANSLRVQRDGFTSQIALEATHAAGPDMCGQDGGGAGLLTPEQVLGLIDDDDESDLSRNFSAHFDKNDRDGNHGIAHSWGDGAGATANLDVLIGGLLKGYTAPPDDQSPFSLNPRVTVSRDGDMSTFTFLANFGIVSIQQREGGVHLACPLRDEIVIVVDRK